MVLHQSLLHLSTIVLGLALPSWASFENTAVVRSIDLGGSLVYTTSTYNVKALEDGSNVYVFALTEKEQETTSWMEARVKGQSAPLSLENHGLSDEYVPDLISVGVVVRRGLCCYFQRDVLLFGRSAKSSRYEQNRKLGVGDRPDTRRIPVPA